jgi:hypothetical protein
MEYQLSCRRASFYLFCQRLQLDTAGLKLVNKTNEISKAPAESIKPPHHKSVTFPQRSEAGVEIWATRVLAASVFLLDLPTFCSFQRVTLKVECLVVRRDSSVTDPHVAIEKMKNVCAS